MRDVLSLELNPLLMSEHKFTLMCTEAGDLEMVLLAEETIII